MKPRDLVDLMLLAALWGGSFMFMRVAAPEFGPVALALVRVAVAAVFLLSALAWLGRLGGLRARAVPLAVVGTINSALPFVLFAYATLTLTAGAAAVMNATTPMWGALIAWLWLREPLGAARAAGLAVGFAGVVLLAGGGAGACTGAKAGTQAAATAAALAAAASYGVAASYARRRLADADPLLIAAGSQVAATLVLAPLAALFWPPQPMSGFAWASAVVMGVASTGWAYVLYFRLIGRVGPARAMTVTYLVPLFAVLWGALLLGERPTAAMLAGGLVVLAGTAIATGVIRPRAPR